MPGARSDREWQDEERAPFVVYGGAGKQHAPFLDKPGAPPSHAQQAQHPGGEGGVNGTGEGSGGSEGREAGTRSEAPAALSAGSSPEDQKVKHTALVSPSAWGPHKHTKSPDLSSVGLPRTARSSFTHVPLDESSTCEVGRRGEACGVWRALIAPFICNSSSFFSHRAAPVTRTR